MSAQLTKSSTNIDRIIAKIDNDFNPDNSDWIPRVGAWVIDAMSQIDALKTVKKRRKLNVKERIAYSPCAIDKDNLKVFDANGCEVKEASSASLGCNCSSTGEFARNAGGSNGSLTPNTIDCINTGKQPSKNYVVAETVNDTLPWRYNVAHYSTERQQDCIKTYVVVDCNKLEINFDADYIYIESNEIETVCSKTYNCEFPVIPNNGVLIEAIAYYCVYKMLCRGYHHQVFNLQASQYGTNPYYIWNNLKEEARRSIINQTVDDVDTSLFRSNFFVSTFDPR